MFGLCLRGRRLIVEFNQVFFRLQLAEVIIMTAEWGFQADARLPVELRLHMST